ncbi:RHS repeat-associated core domain-containing protein [Wenzhouxiangella marina]|uniref:Uncharacterized protein n=1 Tax=Wenzhouxiangella marina TaxID=1579979 RepID=A0A0K0XTG1_9GAMM|nr:RHS repeat-associated core domain-containing protein [Wenzhouxiangella marina]AKS40999.1 hypothetical protein WM2015_617 [Wenzhouxiangella marina]MBB6087873.1 RHS repeat-associated protein [Wenzhouxiangella marina]
MGTFGEEIAQFSVYRWDGAGRLTRRENLAYGYANGQLSSPHLEFFQYDLRDRLTRTHYQRVISSSPGIPDFEQDIGYDQAGNILTKTGVTDPAEPTDVYRYGDGIYCALGAGPHALCGVGAGAGCYSYDLTGNLLADGERTFTYTSSRRLATVEGAGGSARSEYFYGASRNKRVRAENSGQGLRYTIFVGDVEFNYDASFSGGQIGSLRETKKRVGSQVLITLDTVSGVERTHYRHMDHQGSLVALSDENGQTIARMSFDPWGARRAMVAGDNDGWIPYTQPIATAWSEEFQRMLDWTERGYTGHEHMDALGLIHMNGRIYDPVLARFIQSDPFIEDVGTLNRYTYVHNNPLGWVDPSGFTGRPNNTRDRGNHAFRMFASSVIGMATWAYAATSITTGMTVAEKASVAAVAASGSAASTYVATGSVKGAFISFSTALLFNSVGQGFHDKSLPKQMFAHGIVGGVSAAASGGDFARGFMAASFTKMVSPSIQDLPVGALEQTLIAGAVSGLASEISGGKFGLSAVRGAMGYALNQNLSDQTSASIDDVEDDYPDFRIPMRLSDELALSDVQEAYDLLYILNVDSVFQDTEFGRLVDVDGTSIVGRAIGNHAISFSHGGVRYDGPTDNETILGINPRYMAHTHGAAGTNRDLFSPDDIRLSRAGGIPVFLSDHRGNFKVYLPSMGDRDFAGHLLCRACIPIPN